MCAGAVGSMGAEEGEVIVEDNLKGKGAMYFGQNGTTLRQR